MITVVEARRRPILRTGTDRVAELEAENARLRRQRDDMVDLLRRYAIELAAHEAAAHRFYRIRAITQETTTP